jgi:DNA polymerase-3 subunit epsilon
MVVIDVETTGLNPERHCIASLGAVDFSDANRMFYAECRIWDDAEISKSALEINGFNVEQLFDAGKRTVRQVIREFGLWLCNAADKIVAGENPTFDRDFLVAAARRAAIDLDLGHRTVDIHALCYSHHLQRAVVPPVKEGKSDLSLDRTLEYVGLPREAKPHNALIGAKLEAEALSRLIYAKTLLPEFAGYRVPLYLTRGAGTGVS